MKSGLSREEKRVFVDIAWSIDDGLEHGLEDIKGVAVRKDKIPTYMKLFVKKGLYSFDEETGKYKITVKGKMVFGTEKRKAERSSDTTRYVW